MDDNLTTFIPFEKLITKVKAISLAKHYLDNITLETPSKSLDDFCENKFINSITLKLDAIKDFKIDGDNFIRYNLSFNKPLKKFKYNVNLYNIKNFMCFGFDPSKDSTKNIKNLQHLKDHILGIKKK
jgi:hypothetical protein